MYSTIFSSKMGLIGVERFFLPYTCHSFSFILAFSFSLFHFLCSFVYYYFWDQEMVKIDNRLRKNKKSSRKERKRGILVNVCRAEGEHERRKNTISDKKYYTNDPKRYRTTMSGRESAKNWSCSYNRYVFLTCMHTYTHISAYSQNICFFLFIVFAPSSFPFLFAFFVHSVSFLTNARVTKQENIYENSNGTLTSNTEP